MKNIIAALFTVAVLLVSLLLLPLAFKWGMERLFAPGGWQVWLLLGLAVFVIEQFSALRPRAAVRARPARRA
ncbi:MAG TPA: hypothetical protein VLI06_06855 [Solimonas sp.]|nr:hypothetical protein [Solimonas sp.]